MFSPSGLFIDNEHLKIMNMTNFKRKKIVLKLITEIQNSIDAVCERENYTIDYAEINSALIKVINDNNQQELKELWKQEK